MHAEGEHYMYHNFLLDFGRKILGYSVLYNPVTTVTKNHLQSLITDKLSTTTLYLELQCVVTGLHSSSTLRFCAQSLLLEYCSGRQVL